jgi:hypothetical protein
MHRENYDLRTSSKTGRLSNKKNVPFFLQQLQSCSISSSWYESELVINTTRRGNIVNLIKVFLKAMRAFDNYLWEFSLGFADGKYIEPFVQ